MKLYNITPGDNCSLQKRKNPTKLLIIFSLWERNFDIFFIEENRVMNPHFNRILKSFPIQIFCLKLFLNYVAGIKSKDQNYKGSTLPLSPLDLSSQFVHWAFSLKNSPQWHIDILVYCRCIHITAMKYENWFKHSK